MTPAEILPIIAPEFTGMDASNAIGLAELQIAPSLCGDLRPQLVAYLAAHLITIGNRSGQTQGAAGAVTSLKEGQLAITFGGGASGTALSSTSYGAEFERLRRGCVFAAGTRVCL